ncbi:MAG: DUF433 domain-containing protein [Terricaulis sp.]
MKRRGHHEKWIATDVSRFGGRPFILGTDTTVAEVQEYWRRPGIYAGGIRAKFPHLSDAELGAAVTYSPPAEPEESYVAEWEGPPRLKFNLLRQTNARPGELGFSGWQLLVWKFDLDGEEQPHADHWEETREEILRYPELHAPREIAWRREDTGEAVDIYTLLD